MNPLVESIPQVLDNIRRYNDEIAGSKPMQDRLSLHPAWYAAKDAAGEWRFAPSKFVGYRANSARDYLETYDTGGDGGKTEKALERLLPPSLDDEGREGKELHARLSEFLARFAKLPRKGARITVVQESMVIKPTGRIAGLPISDRIVFSPDTCSGRPRIRGTRIRVADILDMMSAGAGREEILADYPDLASADIDAALAYAAASASHRIIQAA